MANADKTLFVQFTKARSIHHGTVTLKGSHRMGDGRVFLKTSVPLFLIYSLRYPVGTVQNYPSNKPTDSKKRAS
jgi:hypothetical protein